MPRLRRSDTSAAGLQRVPRGRGFQYLTAAGSRQYLYHAAWRDLYHAAWRGRRDREKHDHVLAIAGRLPAAREIASTQLSGRALSRERVLTAAFTLLDVGLFRIGGDRYAEENGSYGLMTLQRDHVHCTQDGLVFEYPAQSGKERMLVVLPHQCER